MEEIRMPERGRYRVSLTVFSKDKSTNDTSSQEIDIKDMLIISIGDSASSGEGSPYGGAPQWYDEPCHRSINAAHYQAARDFDAANPHLAVTFLSYACSGAKVRHLWSHAQKDNRPPQIDQIVRDVCGGDSCVESEDRPINRLLFTAGVNDIGFSSIIKYCLKWKNCFDDLGGIVLERIGDLSSLYAQLAGAIEEKLNPREVLTSYYPHELFTDDDGYAADAVDGLIDLKEAGWINKRGESINIRLYSAARQHGWEYTHEVVTLFRGHGYSASEHYYNRVTEVGSVLHGDFDEHGIMHPNDLGQEAWGIAWRHALARLEQPEQRVAVVFTELWIDSDATNVSVDLAVSDQVSTYPGLGESATVYNWVALPENAYRFVVNGRVGDELRVRGVLHVPGEVNPNVNPKNPLELQEGADGQSYSAVDKYELNRFLEYGSEHVLDSRSGTDVGSTGFRAKYRFELIRVTVKETVEGSAETLKAKGEESDSITTPTLYENGFVKGW
jgi:hypothetical protein